MAGDMEKVKFSVYWDRDLVERMDRIAKKFGMSRNEIVLFFVESGLKPVEKMDSSGLLRFVNKLASRKRDVLAARIIEESA